MAIPRLNEKHHSNSKHFDTEPGYTVLVEVIGHVNITCILHLYEDFFDRIVYSCIYFYPQPLNHVILIRIRMSDECDTTVTTMHDLVLSITLPVLMLSAGMQA